MSKTILIQHYTYDLPADKIAAHPLANRDESKLLVYNKGQIQHTAFKSLGNFLPSNAFLFFNDTKVIPARIHFKKETGAEIEIFLLSPQKPSTIMADAMVANKQCTWLCTIGNLKRWKDDQQLVKVKNGISLNAKLIDRNNGIVELSWDTGQSFAEVITEMGLTPLPPYIKRDVSQDDINRYQTIYSHYEGAVAAPTAGLHFTDQILESLQKKGIGKDFLTLHVSAGTFQPVKTENALEHVMHHEQVVISKKSIENLLQPNQFTIAVGTTSMRTLESLYWYGVQLLENPESEFLVTQHDPYKKRNLPSREEALRTILSHMNKNEMDSLTGSTSIFIYPGYEFKICNGLITNFHLPASTLILLVAAFIGDDWQKIYDEALLKDYRFLSYGDSSLLIP
jgi:S-adenosylmethionine:tRNA ribosyltransferase-isomerase